jgi:dipeptidyl aminopeptidase/acylaminoacyl peptidase
MQKLLLASCLAALPFATQAATTAPAAQVPISAFVAEDQASNPRMSPDGKHMAVTMRVPVGKRTVPMVSFYSLPDLKLESTVRLKAFEVPADYYWVSNTRLVMEKAQELGSREAPRLTGEIMAMEFDGSKQEYLFGFDMFKFGSRNRYDDDHSYGFVSQIPEPLNSHVMLSSQPWRTERSILLDVDSRTGVRNERASLPVANMRFVTQHDGTPRFAYGEKENGDFFLMRSDPASGQWSQVDKEHVGSTLRPFAFNADSSEFMAWHSAKGGPQKIIREYTASGERRVMAEDPNGNLSVMHGSKAGMPIAAFTQVGKPRFIYFDEQDPDVQLHKSLSAQFPGDLVRFIDFSADGSKVMFAVSSDRDPGAYYLFDRKTGKADMLMAARDQIEPEQMAERRPISFKTRDGLRLHGYLTMPQHPAGSKLPLVLLPHGGPHGPYDHWNFDSDAQFLASRGYAVLQVNFRGSGGRGPAFQHMGYHQWGGKIMDDLVDGVNWAVAQGEVDAHRMCVYGASFGGYAALMLAAREPDLFKCAVGYAGVYDLAYIFKQDRSITSRRLANVFKKYIGEDTDELARFSPSTQAASIKASVLLIHGGKDDIVDKEHAFRMREALTKAGKPPEWYFVDYEGHGFYDTENATAVYQKLEAFLQKNIGAK